MSVIRAFIAIELTAEIQNRLDEVTTAFKKQLNGVPVRWVPAGNIHLTLKFLGDVSVANVKILTDILKTEVAGPAIRGQCGWGRRFPKQPTAAGDLGGGGGTV